MQYETAGDPMTGLKWTRKTTTKIAQELRALDIELSDRTVAKLLKQMDFSLRVNHKKLSRVSRVSAEERDAQFVRIAELRECFAAKGLPLISVDAKKRELVGRFKNPGAAWNRKPVPVNDHDFRSDAEGIAIPYGIYDMLANRGTVFVGTSYNTPQFAAESIEKWWRNEGRQRYDGADQIAILADGGGNNGATCRAWKCDLHRTLCERHGLTVAVAHYPSGPRSGTRSNTECSVRSAKTGQVVPWTATRPSSTIFGQHGRPQGSACAPILSASVTRRASE